MTKPFSRIPKNYDGTGLTTRRIGEILPLVLSKIGEVYHQKADLIIAMWPNIIGPDLAKMAQAVSFSNGILVVKVKNSTLHSLLSQNEKTRLLRLLRGKFPQIEIKSIYFRIG
jgi:hypothetical protein